MKALQPVISRRKRVPFVRVSGRWLEAFGFKEGAKYAAIGVEGGLRVLTIYEAAPGGGTLPSTEPGFIRG